MRIIIKGLPASVSSADLRLVVETAMASLSEGSDAGIETCDIVRISNDEDEIDEFHGIVSVGPDEAARGVIESLDGTSFQGAVIEAREFHQRTPITPAARSRKPSSTDSEPTRERRRGGLVIDGSTGVPAPLYVDPKLHAAMSHLAMRISYDLDQPDRGTSLYLSAVDENAVVLRITADLAVCLADELDSSVLIIDATFTPMGQPPSSASAAEAIGVNELLSARSLTKKMTLASIRRGVHSNVSHLDNAASPGFGRPARPEAIRKLVDIASSEFDFVLVSGAITSGGARSVAFANAVDASFLVATEGASRMTDLENAQRLLERSGASRIGLVLVGG